MNNSELAVVILAAGKGTRMKSDLPKVLHPLAGRPMVSHVTATASELSPDKVVAIVGVDMAEIGDAVRSVYPTAQIAVQNPPRGTGDGVMQARDALAGFGGDVLVLFGDTPLVTSQTMQMLRASLHGEDGAGEEIEDNKAAVAVLGFRPEDPTGYGRLIEAIDGTLDAIVEHADATPEQQAVTLCNSGVMAIDGARMFELLDQIGNDNAKGEYYLTDIIALARRKGWSCAVAEAPVAEVLGVNSRMQLAEAEAILQSRLRHLAMENGATLQDPETVYFSFDTRLGRDVTVGPQVWFGSGVTIGDNVDIRAFCHIEGAVVANDAVIGPYARLRPEAVIGRSAHIGNFVEVKKSDIGEGAKANHLTYIGDATVGAGANVGAGTITCNYDGFNKHRTEIGEGAFIGSNTSLVAPVKVGDGAITGAGSVITKEVEGDALALTRSDQKQIDGWAARFRAKFSKSK